MIMAGLAFLMMPACNRNHLDAGYWERERERIELAQELNLLEYRLNRVSQAELEEMEVLKLTLNDLGQWSRELILKLEGLVDEVEEMEVRNREYVQLAIKSRRARATGKSFDEFVLQDGRVLRKALVTSVDDGGVEVRHEHGAAKLRNSDLCSDQQDLFGLEEQAAVAAETRERQRALAYARWIDGELEVIVERQAEEQAVTALQAEAKDRLQISRLYAMNASSGSQTKALARPATPVVGRSRHSHSSYRPCRPTYRPVFYYPLVPNRWNFISNICFLKERFEENARSFVI